MIEWAAVVVLLVLAASAFALGWLAGSIHEMRQQSAWLDGHLARLHALILDDEDGTP